MLYAKIVILILLTLAFALIALYDDELFCEGGVIFTWNGMHIADRWIRYDSETWQEFEKLALKYAVTSFNITVPLTLAYRFLTLGVYFLGAGCALVALFMETDSRDLARIAFGFTFVGVLLIFSAVITFETFWVQIQTTASQMFYFFIANGDHPNQVLSMCRDVFILKIAACVGFLAISAFVYAIRMGSICGLTDTHNTTPDDDDKLLTVAN